MRPVIGEGGGFLLLDAVRGAMPHRICNRHRARCILLTHELAVCRRDLVGCRVRERGGVQLPLVCPATVSGHRPAGGQRMSIAFAQPGRASARPTAITRATVLGFEAEQQRKAAFRVRSLSISRSLTNAAGCSGSHERSCPGRIWPSAPEACGNWARTRRASDRPARRRPGS